jgi:hypothetical protein
VSAGATLDVERPVEYQCDALQGGVAILSRFRRREVASELRISERAWRSIATGTSKPRRATRDRNAERSIAR